jgi:hypothetical protein
MADPRRMLDEQVREELKIGEPSTSPLREGWTTGAATAVGAIIPVLPFFFAHGPTAIAISFTVAMLSHFLVGAARSIFTGRGLFRSGSTCSSSAWASPPSASSSASACRACSSRIANREPKTRDKRLSPASSAGLGRAQ